VFEVQGLGSRVQVLELRVLGSGLRVWALELGLMA